MAVQAGFIKGVFEDWILVVFEGIGFDRVVADMFCIGPRTRVISRCVIDLVELPDAVVVVDLAV